VGDTRQQAGHEGPQGFNLEGETEIRKKHQETGTLARLCRAQGPGALQIRSKVHWQHSLRHRSGTMDPEVHRKNIVEHVLTMCLRHTLPILADFHLIKKTQNPP